MSAEEKIEVQNDDFVVGENYNFWLNEKDEDYETKL